MTDLATLGLAIDSSKVDAATKNLREFTEATRRADQSAGSLSTSTDRAERSMAGFRGAIAAVKTELKAAAATFAVAFAVSGSLRAADAYTEFANRIRVAGAEGEAFAEVQDRIFAAANRNGAAVNAIAEVYSRTAQVSEELGASQEDLLSLVDGVAAAITVQGTSTAEASGALRQLGQALGESTIRAEEFNSINDQLPVILQAAASAIEGVDGSVSRLRRAVLNGEISNREFFNALLIGLADVEEKASGMESTVSAAMTALSNAFILFIGRLNEGVGITSGLNVVINALASALVFLSDNMGYVLVVVRALIAALVIVFGPAMIAGVKALAAAIGTRLLDALLAVNKAARGSPLMAFVQVFQVIATAAFIFRDQIEEVFGVDVVNVAKQAANAVIGAFKTAYDVTLLVWSSLPEQFTDLGLMAAQGLLNGLIQGMPANRIGRFVASQMGLEVNAPQVDFSGMMSEEGERLRDRIRSTAQRNAQRDFLGGSNAASNGGMSAESAADDYRQLIDALGGGTGAAGGGSGAGGAGGGNGDGSPLDILSQVQEAAEAAKAQAVAVREAWRDFTGAFVSDLRQGLKQGEGFFKAFADAALNALDRVIGLLIDSGLNALFGTTGSGPGLGALLGGLGSLFGAANGAAFAGGGVVPFARGGIVGGPTAFPMRGGRTGLMGEAGPEAIMPLRRGRNGRLGVEMAGGGELVIRLDKGLRAEMAGEMEGVAVRVVQDGLATYDRTVAPRTAERIRSDPRRRG